MKLLASRRLRRLRPRAEGRSGFQLLSGIVLLAVLAIGLSSSIYVLFFSRDRFSVGEVSWRAFARGEMTSNLSEFLKHHIPFADGLVTADRVIGWLVVGDLGPRVREGCDGWLFLIDELEIHRDGDAAFRFRLRIIDAVAKFLQRRGIALLIVPVPDKSRVEATQLCGIRRPKLLGGRLEQFTSRLQENKIRFVDIYGALAALGGERYYRTDTHWNEPGARRAAEEIAASLQHLKLAPASKESFRVITEPPHERIGDLIHLAGLDHVPWPLRPRGDLEAPSRIEQKTTREVGPFDDIPPPEVVVIGTSFSRRANFTQFLSLLLGAPVANMAKDGGGLVTAALAYFSNPAFTETPPRVVIWEIPERILDNPITKSEQIEAEKLGLPGIGTPASKATSASRR